MEVLPIAEENYRPNPNTKIEYKPIFKKENEKIRYGFAENDSLKESISDLVLEENTVGTGLIKYDVLETITIKNNISEAIGKLLDELKDFHVEVDTGHEESLINSKLSLGLEPVSSINVLDYKKALDNVKNPYGQYIVELFESEQEDVYGNLKAELIGELFEMEKEANHIVNFIDKIVGQTLLNKEIDYTDENWKEELLIAEKEMEEFYQAVVDRKEKNEEKLISALTTEPSLLNEAKVEKEDLKKYYKNILYKKNTLLDAHSILSIKNNEMSYHLGLISNNLEREPFDDYQEVIKPMVEITKDEKDMKIALTNSNVMLKLSVDSSNNKKSLLKNRLRNTFSVDKRENILEELETANIGFQDIVSDLEARLLTYNSYQTDEMELILEGIAEGISLLNEERNSKLKEFYNVSMAESSLREEKLTNILKKDDKRKAFILFESIKENVETKGFPIIDNYSTFIE